MQTLTRMRLTMVNDFRPFGSAMAKLSTGAKTIASDGSEVELTTALDKKRRIEWLSRCTRN
jgi:type I restriction enzyme, R subunit